MIPIKVKKLKNFISLPQYATQQSAGMDLCAAIGHEVTISPMERVVIPTGIAIALPEGFEAQIRPRSGLALKHGISIPNSPGTIDADYRGEVGVALVNLGKEAFVVEPGMRIAQMVIAEYKRAEWIEAEELSETKRGQGGFGSTGINAK